MRRSWCSARPSVCTTLASRRTRRTVSTEVSLRRHCRCRRGLRAHALRWLFDVDDHRGPQGLPWTPAAVLSIVAGAGLLRPLLALARR
jgi:hypothetical protein